MGTMANSEPQRFMLTRSPKLGHWCCRREARSAPLVLLSSKFSVWQERLHRRMTGHAPGSRLRVF